ncbi:hypothetical protein IGI39_004029 [Enterococcus sp. AZ135]
MSFDYDTAISDLDNQAFTNVIQGAGQEPPRNMEGWDDEDDEP